MLFEIQMEEEALSISCITERINICPPRIFTKVLKPVYAHLRQLGFIASGYIDDSSLMADSYDTCSENVRVTKPLLESVGFSINFAKSMLTPRQKMEHLGFVLDSQTITVSVTKDINRTS